MEEIRRKLAWSRRSGQSSPQSRTQGEFRKSAKLLSIVRTQYSHLDYRLRKTNRLSSQVGPPTWQIKYQGLSGATRVNSRVVFSPKQTVRAWIVTQWSAITIITNRHRREKIKVTCKSYWKISLRMLQCSSNNNRLQEKHRQVWRLMTISINLINQRRNHRASHPIVAKVSTSWWKKFLGVVSEEDPLSKWMMQLMILLATKIKNSVLFRKFEGSTCNFLNNSPFLM